MRIFPSIFRGTKDLSVAVVLLFVLFVLKTNYFLKGELSFFPISCHLSK